MHLIEQVTPHAASKRTISQADPHRRCELVVKQVLQPTFVLVTLHHLTVSVPPLRAQMRKLDPVVRPFISADHMVMGNAELGGAVCARLFTTHHGLKPRPSYVQPVREQVESVRAAWQSLRDAVDMQERDLRTRVDAFAEGRLLEVNEAMNIDSAGGGAGKMRRSVAKSTASVASVVAGEAGEAGEAQAQPVEPSVESTVEEDAGAGEAKAAEDNGDNASVVTRRSSIAMSEAAVDNSRLIKRYKCNGTVCVQPIDLSCCRFYAGS